MEAYRWYTEEPHSTNTETMNDYLENHLNNNFKIHYQDDSYAEIINKNTKQLFSVNASGDGDFNNHIVTFNFIQ